jgi:murein hydrolase activator
MVDASLTPAGHDGREGRSTISSRFAILRDVSLWLALTCASLAPAYAQQDAASLELQREETAAERERLQRELEAADERINQLAEEVEALRKDSATITAALVDAAATERRLANDVEASNTRLAGLRDQQGVLRASLAERRDLLAEVLGALQRLGVSPPPAILVRPEDALSSVRSAILLGSVVPELRGETQVLLADLNELAHVSAQIESERERLVAAMREQVVEQQRMDLLLAEKQRLREASEEQIVAESERSRQLADQAGSLNELIDALEAEIDIARRAEETRRAQEAAAANRPPAPVPTPELFASVPFSNLRGQVVPPVSGAISKRFGGDDGTGGQLMGDMFATHSNAIVTAPSDGSILYAGPFRSYGQLLILNAGDGYHIVLAGLARISVALGQTVVAGEPIGAMSEARIASAAGMDGTNAGPELYVEFRKDGSPIDPAPWWAGRNTVRTGNGT